MLNHVEPNVFFGGIEINVEYEQAPNIWHFLFFFWCFCFFWGGVGSGGNKEKGLVASRENWYFMVLKGLKVRIHVQKMEAGVIWSNSIRNIVLLGQVLIKQWQRRQVIVTITTIINKDSN